jgi:hypothetical protein
VGGFVLVVTFDNYFVAQALGLSYDDVLNNWYFAAVVSGILLAIAYLGAIVRMVRLKQWFWLALLLVMLFILGPRPSLYWCTSSPGQRGQLFPYLAPLAS